MARDVKRHRPNLFKEPVNGIHASLLEHSGLCLHSVYTYVLFFGELSDFITLISFRQSLQFSTI